MEETKMLQITIIKGDKITQRNNFNEPNPYRLIMDLIAQANWKLNMVTFARFRSGLSAKLDANEKNEIVVEY